MKKNIFKTLIILAVCFSISGVAAKSKAVTCTYKDSEGKVYDFKINGKTVKKDGTKVNVYSDTISSCKKSVNVKTAYNYNVLKRCPDYFFEYKSKNKKTVWIASNENVPANKKASSVKNPTCYAAVQLKIEKEESPAAESSNEQKNTAKKATTTTNNTTTPKTSGKAYTKAASKTDDYSSFYNEAINYRKCGSLDHIPMSLPIFTNALYTLIKILVPVILILFGIIDFAKAVMSKDESAMNEQKNKFIKRLIGAVLVFFVFSIVQFAVGLTSSANDITDESGRGSCIDCFINNYNKCEVYTYNEENNEKSSSQTSNENYKTSTTSNSEDHSSGGADF